MGSTMASASEARVREAQAVDEQRRAKAEAEEARRMQREAARMRREEAERVEAARAAPARYNPYLAHRQQEEDEE